MYICEWCGSGITSSGEHIREDLAPCFGVTYYETQLREATWRNQHKPWCGFQHQGPCSPEPGVKMMSPTRKKLARLGWKWRTESTNRIKNLIGYSLYERFKV